MKTFISSWVVAGTLAFGALAYADHDKSCKNVHGKVTVITEDGISVNDKMYKVGKTTRITKGEKEVKLSQISSGDIVCVDVRGKDDIGSGEIAAVAVLSPPEPSKEKEYVREKETVRQLTHDKNCNHVHGKVTRVEKSTLIVDGKPYACREKTRIVKGNETVTIETIKTGDFVCMDAGTDKDEEHKVTTVLLLSPSDAAPFQTREIIREREKIREEK